MRAKRKPGFRFTDAAYQHYDPATGHGSAENWEATARLLMSELFGTPAPDAVPPKPDIRGAGDPLRILTPGYSPATLEVLKSAFRAAANVTHPDKGGTSAEFRKVVEVYERIRRQRRWS